MKKIILYTTALLLMASCSKMMDTEPTTESSLAMLETTDGLKVALDGIYASMYNRIDYLTANTHQTFGNMAIFLAADLMGEDMVQTAKGPGWFWNDYTYGVRERYASKIQRCYFVWSYFYELINNANAILAAEETATGDSAVRDCIIGQAYAIRAFCYFMLIQSYQQTYIGHQGSPGVPVYTVATTSSSEAKGRGTVQQVYDLILRDIEQSLLRLEASGLEQDHISHLDKYAVNLLKGRIALVMNDWDTAIEAADIALSKPGCHILSQSEATVVKGKYSPDIWTTGSTPFNDVTSADVLWGMEIISSQSNVYGSFFSNMDACTDVYYAAESPKCISNWLYAHIPDSDIRKGWWNGDIGIPSSAWGYGANINYNQHKFQWKNQTALAGDYIFMRMEEACLIKAEALCHAGRYQEARDAISALGGERDPHYAERLALMADSNQLRPSSCDEPETLMDEIILQRRIELWGEAGRIYDIHRLGQNWTRSWTVNGQASNHSDLLSRYAEYQAFPSDYIESILLIPQTEIDINPYIEAQDQNPYVN